jgi:hypothetical protein
MSASRVATRSSPSAANVHNNSTFIILFLESFPLFNFAISGDDNIILKYYFYHHLAVSNIISAFLPGTILRVINKSASTNRQWMTAHCHGDAEGG